jgi:thioredoxin reductase (NADPH)
MQRYELIVVGGGIGGSAATLRAAQYHLPTVWILGDKKTRLASRAEYVKNIDNMIGIHPGIVLEKVERLLEEEYPEAAQKVSETHMDISTVDIIANARRRIEKNFAGYVTIVEQRAEEALKIDTGYRVSVTDGGTYEGGALLLSTGVMDRQPVVYREKNGRELANINWIFPYANQETLLYCIRCEGHLTIGKRVGVIGSGNSTAEVSLMLRERYGIEVVILTAGEEPSWNQERNRYIDAYGIRVVEGKLVDIHGENKGATLKGFTVESGETVSLDLAFVCMGLFRVYNEIARSLGAQLEGKGESDEVRHVMIDMSGETSVPGFFVVGDMASRENEPVMKQIYTAQEYAVRAVDTVDRRRRLAARESGVIP